MGKLARKKVAARRGKASKSQESVPGHMAEAERALSRFDYEAAAASMQAALKLDAKNVDVMDALGEVLMSYLGEEELAKQVLDESIRLAPDQGHSKYMSIGQMLGGAEALAYYQKGANNLVAAIEAAPTPEEKLELKDILAKSFCAVAELWTTDLCMEDGAEHNCKAALDFACEQSPENPEVHALYAQLYLRKDDLTACKASLARTMALLQDAPDDTMPGVESRIEIAKLLLQVDEFSEAYGLLKSILLDDDGNGYLYYLMAECLRRMQKFQRSYRHLLKAKGIASRVAGDSDEQGDDGPQAFLAKVDTLLAEVRANLSPPQAQTEEQNLDAGWVTDSDDEREVTPKEAAEILRQAMPQQEFVSGDAQMS
ncbi:putative assembly chaperone of rpl4 [Diplonema papillatum]|nr:putative assembly chaperone of rpl4 [Diplonema papillatum]